MALTLHKLTKANGALCVPAVLFLVRPPSSPLSSSHPAAQIKELALFEKAPDSVEATEELLYQNLLNEGPRGAQYAECVLVYEGGSPEEGGQAVAMALYLCVPSCASTGEGGRS